LQSHWDGSWSAVAIVVLIASVVSCGGDRGTARIAPPTDCSTPDPGVSAAEIRVGGIYPTSGPNGGFFRAVGAGVGARFAAENEQGGVGGRRLTLVPADDGDGEVANLTAARQLVVTEKVFGIIEGTTSSDGSGKFLADNNVPVTGWGITPAWGTYDNMFGYRYSTSPKPEGEAVTRSGQFIKDHGGRRVAIVAGGAIASVNVANQLADTLPALGLELGYKTVDVPLGGSDFSVEVQRMKDAGVDALYTGLATSPNVALYQAAVDAGIKFKVVLFPAGYDGRLAAAFGAQLEGTYFSIDWRPFELPVPAHDRFKRMLALTAPDEYPGQLAMVGWLSADAFIRGLREAGDACPTRRAFMANLRQVKDYTGDGLLPPTDFGAVFGKMPLCSWVLQLHNSQFVPVDGQPICGVLLKDYRG
jgi:branched-chain amino acid transport system substrate-binding protein